ncbi:30S ribosomal protein S4 [Candidatus Wolfebacteria bacterium CG03_land_8_20_14_0_80_40_12]|uniref:Small ribosomal subunit protein uS4 n=1 Tax=Candidatus Wolfebacteria bacterium CG03_land_8_20_14_0_80_40_12 TaxID=1975069 RepID=A0A2M7B5W4_9BACT|nr:MAG: 30S ribosomal protein S4 [Candidatus Wolfebacteria bacterium CG03_land_8_20_14_0_80_40_12]
MKKSAEKLERSLGAKLFLKAERCNSPKCAMIRRPQRPGIHGKKRQRAKTEYGQQLLEKQRIRASYGLKERQLTRIVGKAIKKIGSATESLIKILECQLSNAIFRLGMAPSRTVARQLISHGHFLVNSKKVTISSYAVKVGDVISIKPSSAELLIFKGLSDKIRKNETPEWLTFDEKKLEGRIKSLPQNVEMPFDINLVVDYYSK